MNVDCIVCGNEFDLSAAADRLEDEESRFYFCSDSCRERFEEEPEIFLLDPDDDWQRELPATA